MKERKPEYPASLFWTGVAINILRSLLWLAVSTILLILGIRTPWCAWAGLSLLGVVLAVAVGKQIAYRHAMLHSDSSELADWQAATLSPEWKDNVLAMVERAMQDDPELDRIASELTDEEESDDDGAPDGGED